MNTAQLTNSGLCASDSNQRISGTIDTTAHTSTHQLNSPEKNLPESACQDHELSLPLSAKSIRSLSKQEVIPKVNAAKSYFLTVVTEANSKDRVCTYPMRQPLFLADLCKVFEQINLLPLTEQKPLFEKLYRETTERFDLCSKSFKLKSIYLSIIQGQIDRVENEIALLKEWEYHPAITNYDSREIWRLFIDGQQQSRGKFAFEDEPGYLAGMFASFRLMLEQKRQNQCLSIDLIQELLKTSASFTHTINRNGSLTKLDIKMVGGSVIHTHIPTPVNPTIFLTLSKNGYKEIKKESAKIYHYSLIPPLQYKLNGQIFTERKSFLNPNYTLDAYFNDDEDFSEKCTYSLTTTPTKKHRIRNCLTAHIEEYQKNIKPPCSRTKTLTAIVRCISELVRLHPFRDGNGRIFQMLLCNRLLLDNHFTPVIWDNPSIACGFSQQEILSDLRKAQLNFRRRCEFRGLSHTQTTV